MRSATNRTGAYIGALLVALALIALAVAAGLVIDTHRKEHGHDVARWPGAQGGESQVVGAGVHGLNSSNTNGAGA